ncbi:cell wall metabolism sensor histidine kinase WalK [Actinoplanes sp. TFC3]|uniref:sensor histidine kinase n=1 Tax=Actinoplanes sp. TFC3 TaxID=1710355 RepID=UPI000833F227|nr:HAMP domain-containing sensor histidine kinase [Actinoplanes sp. TFC3]
MKKAGLRVRVIAGFAAGALALSATLALVSFQVIRQSLLSERERTAVRAAYYDAAIVWSGLGSQEVGSLLRTLDTGDSRRAVLYRDGEWYSRQADTGVTDAIPVALQREAGDGIPSVQRVRAEGRAALVVAVPLSPTAVFYEVDSLQELDHTLGVLTAVLTAVGVSVAALGALLGWYASRYVLRPLTRVADAAQEIAGGAGKYRLDPAAEPDLARLTTSFNHMVDELQARLERDRRFAADVSHELRSPLQTLANAASVLERRRDQLDARTATAAGLITDEIARFQHLVNDLLELSRGDRPATRAPVDLPELARRVCRDHRISPDIVTLSGPATWCVDRGRVGQLMGNLLENAQAFGGGAVAVRLALTASTGRIEVDDEGPGVSPDDKPVIFDRFVRGRSANARADSAGTGLGLALVAQHAAAHGGTASVHDRPGGGARFRVELPECAP